MNIGQAAKFSGVSAKMIRYYEQIGLVPKANRSDAGYRNYGSQDVQSLRFIRRARDLGFSVEQISELLVLWGDPDRACVDVKAMALTHVAGLKAKIADLQAMAQTLEQLADQCHGNDRPDCPIIAGLAERTAAVAVEQRPRVPHRPPRFGGDTPASSHHRAAMHMHS
ncbi:Cu(I)-responsive transcriptional regulator [Pseudomonas sp. 15FMM2]|uniref:Cu(I)-responsive transcriptional regulator n=1 Tax=Pseudomonas imrae TaxID=2992837 RepID=A0ACC7PCM0_9PSED